MESCVDNTYGCLSKHKKGKRIFAVAGYPVLHSLSPIMFNEAFRACAIDAVYTRIAAFTAEEALRVAQEIGMAGMNVTAPFKEAIYDLVDEVEGEAKEIGAINTVLFEDNKTKGLNTDVAGVRDAFYGNGISLTGKKIALLGSGGAASAAAYALKKEGAEVTVVNRTYEKARMLCERTKCKIAHYEELDEVIEASEIIVSAVSFTGTLVKSELLKENQIIFDANYRRETPLVRDGKKRGCTIIDGKEWLVYQGAEAFKYFTGCDAPVKAMQDAICQKNVERKRHMAFIGFMGSGKTTIGQIYAKKNKMDFFDMDRLIEEKSGMSIKDIFKNYGEETFRTMEGEVLENLKNMAPSVISCGGGAVLKDNHRDILKKRCVNIWLWADGSTLVQRIMKDGSRPLLEGISKREELEKMIEMRVPYYADTSDMVISTVNKKKKEVVSRLCDEDDTTVRD